MERQDKPFLVPRIDAVATFGTDVDEANRQQEAFRFRRSQPRQFGHESAPAKWRELSSEQPPAPPAHLAKAFRCTALPPRADLLARPQRYLPAFGSPLAQGSTRNTRPYLLR